MKRADRYIIYLEQINGKPGLEEVLIYLQSNVMKWGVARNYGNSAVGKNIYLIVELGMTASRMASIPARSPRSVRCRCVSSSNLPLLSKTTAKAI